MIRTAALLLALVSSTSFATPTLQPVCVQGRLARVVVQDTGPSNLCAEAKLSPEQESFISYLGALNQRVADFLKIPLGDLLPNPIAVEVMASTGGPLTSLGGFGEIDIGVFTDWNLGTLNEPVYIHELGHVLVDSAAPALPPALHSLSNSAVMVEGFADMLAFGIAGSVMNDGKLPRSCSNGRGRMVTQYQSYGFPKAFFEPEFGVRRLVACCKRPVSKSPHDQAFCEDIAPLEAQLPKLDRRTAFNPLDFLAHLERYDVHEIGIPFNSYLHALEVRLGLPSVELVMKGLGTVSGAGATLFHCQASGHTASVQVPSVERLLHWIDEQAGASALALQHPELAREIWEKHRMDQAAEIGRLQALTEAGAAARAALCANAAAPCEVQCVAQ